MSLTHATVAITGASRGLGRAIARHCAAAGCNVALLARSASAPSHKGLCGTLEDVAEDVERLGGTPLVLETDISDLESVRKSMGRIGERFGALDALVNNASALYVGNQPKRAELLFRVNLQGTLNAIEMARPLLERGRLKHILSISPPVDSFSIDWACPHPAYTASKYGMSMITLGYARAFCANTLWPRKLYKTAATERMERELGQPYHTRGLDPPLFASAVEAVLSSRRTGTCLLDGDVVSLPDEGIDDIFL